MPLFQAICFRPPEAFSIRPLSPVLVLDSFHLGVSVYNKVFPLSNQPGNDLPTYFSVSFHLKSLFCTSNILFIGLIQDDWEDIRSMQPPISSVNFSNSEWFKSIQRRQQFISIVLRKMNWRYGSDRICATMHKACFRRELNKRYLWDIEIKWGWILNILKNARAVTSWVEAQSEQNLFRAGWSKPTCHQLTAFMTCLNWGLIVTCRQGYFARKLEHWNTQKLGALMLQVGMASSWKPSVP